jgi:hypothetical protein
MAGGGGGGDAGESFGLCECVIVWFVRTWGEGEGEGGAGLGGGLRSGLMPGW